MTAVGDDGTGRAVAALAIQVKRLRGILDQAGIDGTVDLAAAIRQLATAVTQLADDGPAGRGPAMPRWHQLTVAEHWAALRELNTWVDDTLTAQFPAARPRPCWARHPDVVWELSALHTEWRRIQAGKQPSTEGMLNWLDRWLPRASARIREAQKDCDLRCSAPSDSAGQTVPGRFPGIAR